LLALLYVGWRETVAIEQQAKNIDEFDATAAEQVVIELEEAKTSSPDASSNFNNPKSDDSKVDVSGTSTGVGRGVAIMHLEDEDVHSPGVEKIQSAPQGSFGFREGIIMSDQVEFRQADIDEKSDIVMVQEGDQFFIGKLAGDIIAQSGSIRETQLHRPSIDIKTLYYGVRKPNFEAKIRAPVNAMLPGLRRVKAKLWPYSTSEPEAEKPTRPEVEPEGELPRSKASE